MRPNSTLKWQGRRDSKSRASGTETMGSISHSLWSPHGTLRQPTCWHVLTWKGFMTNPTPGILSRQQNGSGETHRKRWRAEDHLSLGHCLWPWEHFEQHPWVVLYSLGACSRQKPLGISHTGLVDQYQLPLWGVMGCSQKSPLVFNQVMVTPPFHVQMKRGLLKTDARRTQGLWKKWP